MQDAYADAILSQTRTAGIFPTPAFLCRLQNPEPLNRQLRDIILARELAEGGLVNSNVGGWHSGRDLATWGGGAVDAVLGAAMEIASKATRDRKGRPVRPTWQVECWANVNRKGHANKRHSHPGCYWSGAYYVDIGDGVGEDFGGEFQFHDPRGGALLDNPAARIVATGDAVPLVRPEPGLFVIFPSWMLHSVRPYQAGGTRISIAFNLALPRGPAP
jgi:uncharacterized protein (TIGR02466 family)